MFFMNIIDGARGVLAAFVCRMQVLACQVSGW
jgi:hypothetical protein